ncbi:UbiA prenyltransferase family protein [Pontibacter sp. BT310]|uniref:UbiA family prenyltransferase n=1 Tax=Pontibacter populi TaxID=890055 RepID=A0ABS6X9N4_9BACT|nr:MULTISPECIES: UbiA family prenyltransferase [Pontibacter]MBJ6117052.1 UbiA prenyltransferase family protein [Pontibacter sp. BT310]MBR0569476.1 UbiA prenyltransferase family protein [Microvirga sp. STS03]MBW3363905.1 UbiA family prenyltransferase [Pontibacter populi]
MKRYRDALTLMRIPFSVYLMPVFWFALSALQQVTIGRAIVVFLILHLLVYPASNGYNSYYDRDEGSIGGLKHPPKVNRELMHLVLLFDMLAVLLSIFLSPLFAVLVALYLLISKAYSYEGIRLKKYPIISTIVVTFFQGAFTFAMVQVGVGLKLLEVLQFPNFGFAIVSTLFLCGSYPLTQIYQHHEDSQRGDITISLLLGITGTYIFAAISLLLGTGVLLWLYYTADQFQNIIIFLIATAPILYYFTNWAIGATRNNTLVNYDNTMHMNKISSVCISIAFITMLVFKAIYQL